MPPLVARSRRSMTSSRRPPNSARAPKPMARTATTPPPAATSSVGFSPASRSILDLHLDHLAHPQEAKRPADDAVAQHVVPDRLVEHGHQVGAIGGKHEDRKSVV